MKLSLVGFMGSGKSTIGYELARHLEHEVIEMDAHVLANIGAKDMNEVFEKGGEKLLRDWEVRLAEEWRDLQNAIISTGGGAITNSAVVQYLKENNGKIIYLYAPFATIAERIKQDSIPRPLFQNIEQAEKLYRARLPLYHNSADIIIDTDQKELVSIVKEIMNAVHL